MSLSGDVHNGAGVAGDVFSHTDFCDTAGEREMAPKCGSLLRDAGDLVGLVL